MKNKRRYETYIDRNVILLWLLREFGIVQLLSRKRGRSCSEAS
jgi:hypothetical protein